MSPWTYPSLECYFLICGLSMSYNNGKLFCFSQVKSNLSFSKHCMYCCLPSQDDLLQTAHFQCGNSAYVEMSCKKVIFIGGGSYTEIGHNSIDSNFFTQHHFLMLSQYIIPTIYTKLLGHEGALKVLKCLAFSLQELLNLVNFLCTCMFDIGMYIDM